MTRATVAALTAGLVLAGCTPTAEPIAAPPTTPVSTGGPTARPTVPPLVVRPSPRPRPPRPAPMPTVRPTPKTDATPPPKWLYTRVLPRRPDGWGERRPTPPALRDRRLYSPDHLPPPPSLTFTARITRAPKHVVARSTWRPDCPLPLRELRYATFSFWGFDDRPHTGEMIVNARVAEDLVGVMRKLYRARFPIEEMRVRRTGEIDAPPTGDINNTDVFDCRPATGGSNWSQHAYGLAIDINPFHNPYLKGDLVVPELAEAYLERDWHRPGMIQPGDVVTRAFADIGWGWGGEWNSLKDWQHFSASGG